MINDFHHSIFYKTKYNNQNFIKNLEKFDFRSIIFWKMLV